MSDAAEIILDCQRRLDKVRRAGGSWFRGGDGSLNHGTFHAQLAPYHDRVYHEGKVTWGALVMAQPVLFSRGGNDSTGTIVYSFDKEFAVQPEMLVRVAGNVGALKKAVPKDPILVAFAAEVRNDEAREIDRMVPHSLTLNRQVRYETIYIQRHRLPTGYLAHTLFPIIISTAQPTQPMLLPLDYWAPELVEHWQELARRNPPAEAPREAGPITQNRYAAARPGYDPYVDDAPPAGAYGARHDDNPGRFGTPSPTTMRAASYEPQPQYPSQQQYAPQQPQHPAQPAFTAPPKYAVEPEYHPDPYQPQPRTQPHPTQAAHTAHAAHAAQAAHAAHAGGDGDAFAANPMRLTPTAAAVLRLMLRQQGLAEAKVRVTVEGRGCQIAFTSEPPDPRQDYMYACDGVTLLVDRDSASVLAGVTMDLPASPQQIGFIFGRVA